MHSISNWVHTPISVCIIYSITALTSLKMFISTKYDINAYTNLFLFSRTPENCTLIVLNTVLYIHPILCKLHFVIWLEFYTHPILCK